MDSIELRLIKTEDGNKQLLVALDSKVSAAIFHSYTDSDNKKVNYIELQPINLRTSIKNLEEHQNIVCK